MIRRGPWADAVATLLSPSMSTAPPPATEILTQMAIMQARDLDMREEWSAWAKRTLAQVEPLIAEMIGAMLAGFLEARAKGYKP